MKPKRRTRGGGTEKRAEETGKLSEETRKEILDHLYSVKGRINTAFELDTHAYKRMDEGEKEKLREDFKTNKKAMEQLNGLKGNEPVGKELRSAIDFISAEEVKNKFVLREAENHRDDLKAASENRVSELRKKIDEYDKRKKWWERELDLVAKEKKEK